MSNADVIWLVVNALFLLVCVVILHEGVRDFNSEFRNSPLTIVLLAGGLVGTGAFTFLTLKSFGHVFANWSFADAMKQPGFTDWATLAGIILAIAFVGCAIVGLVATATYKRRRVNARQLQHVR